MLNLKIIFLGNNRLKKVQNETFNDLNLVELYLNINEIENITFNDLTIKLIF